MSTALRPLSRSHTMLSSYTRTFPSSFTRHPFYRKQTNQLAALSSTSRKYTSHEQPSPGTPLPPPRSKFRFVRILRLCLAYLSRPLPPPRNKFMYILRLGLGYFPPPPPPPPGNKFSYIMRQVLTYSAVGVWRTILLTALSTMLHHLSLRRFILDDQPDDQTLAEMSRFFEALHEFLNAITGKKKYNTDPTWEQLQKNWARTGKNIVSSLVYMDTIQALALSEEEVDALESGMRAKVIIMRESERLVAELKSLEKEGAAKKRKILMEFFSKMVQVTNLDIGGEEEGPTWVI
ncbi:hypothetical protein BDQ17DRAFT_1434242 [Cyathus striatus]|nr:hypothetical protein BDQ17DRAFT_1434242 [Cyathus striatus]